MGWRSAKPELGQKTLEPHDQGGANETKMKVFCYWEEGSKLRNPAPRHVHLTHRDDRIFRSKRTLRNLIRNRWTKIESEPGPSIH